MTLDLDDRLRAYRPTLDDAIGAARRDVPVMRRRRRAPLAAAALVVVIAGGAGLVALAQRDAASRGSASSETAAPSFDSAAPFGVAPFFVLDDPHYVPVEFQGVTMRTDPSSRSGTFIYASNAEGVVHTIEVGVSTYAHIGTEDADSVTVRGRPAVARQAGEAVVVTWAEESGVGVHVAVMGNDVEASVRIADSLIVGDDAAWYAALEAIMTVHDPLIEQWRAERRETFCSEPVEFTFGEDLGPGCR